MKMKFFPFYQQILGLSLICLCTLFCNMISLNYLAQLFTNVYSLIKRARAYMHTHTYTQFYKKEKTLTSHTGLFQATYSYWSELQCHVIFRTRILRNAASKHVVPCDQHIRIERPNYDRIKQRPFYILQIPWYTVQASMVTLQ